MKLANDVKTEGDGMNLCVSRCPSPVHDLSITTDNSTLLCLCFRLRPPLHKSERCPLDAFLLDHMVTPTVYLLGSPVTALPVWVCDWPEATWPYTVSSTSMCAPLADIRVDVFDCLFFYISKCCSVPYFPCLIVVYNVFYADPERGHKPKHNGLTIQLFCTQQVLPEFYLFRCFFLLPAPWK